MFDTFEFASGTGNHRVFAMVVLCGADMVIIVGGGERPHIGALGASISPSVYTLDAVAKFSNPRLITFPNHKEGEIVRNAVTRLSDRLKRNVVVTAGLHITNASNDDIQLLVDNFNELVDSIQAGMANKT
jgi:gallate decarboxylase subunit D